MLTLVLFLLPGFCALLLSLALKNQKNVDPNQWALILALGLNSLFAFTLAKVFSIPFSLIALETWGYKFQPIAEFSDYITSLEYFVALFMGLAISFYGFNIFSILQPTSGINELLKNHKDELIMVTLDDGKIYVGTLSGFDVYAGAELNSINIWPFFSGHRDKEDGKFHVSTGYIKMGPEKEVTFLNDHHVQLGLMMKKIVSVRNFVMKQFIDYIENSTVTIDDEHMKKIFEQIADAQKKSSEKIASELESNVIVS